MFCSKCGQENDNNARFCVQCREPFKSTNTISSHKTFSPADLRDGKLLDNGRYRIIGNRPCGSGGMGEVWRAEDTELQMTVAIKVLPGILAINKASIENLKREASIALRLTHPGICRLYNFCSDADVKFLVMEYIEGQTLEEYIDAKQEGRLSIDELLPIARQIADALDYAHNAVYMDASGRKVRGVLHRDIKPSNIMLNSEGLLKVLDFGIAREVHETMARVTAPKSTSQTPDYASPEQFRGDPTTAASDIYSFTAVIYECLAGRPLIQARGNLEYQILKREFEPLPAQTEVVNSALKSGLAKDPDERPPTASALVDLLVAAPDTPQIKSLRRQASQAQADKDFETERDLLAEIRRVAPYDRDVAAINERITKLRSLAQAQRVRQARIIAASAILFVGLVIIWSIVNVARGRNAAEEVDVAFKQKRYDAVQQRYNKVAGICRLPLVPDGLVGLKAAAKLRDGASDYLRQIESSLLKADGHFRNEEYRLARGAYVEALNIQSDHGYAQDRVEVIDDLEQIIASNIESARKFHSQKEYIEAKSHIEKVLGLQRSNQEATELLGKCDEELGEYDGKMRQANAAAKERDLDAAIRLYGEALRLYA
ncbi:MAG: protein kinase, partial [Planctomycetes bacterium]|nr:protein kinase [Planctomycetota bacterium]